MKREKIFYTAAIVLLVAALIGCLYYKRPLDIKELTGVTDPDDIAISVILTDGDMGPPAAGPDPLRRRRGL